MGRTLDLRISLTPAPILLHPSHHFLLLAPLPRYLYLTTLAFPLLCADLPHYLRQTIATYVMLGTISSLRLFKGAPDHEKAGLELLVAQHMRPVDIAPGVNSMCDYVDHMCMDQQMRWVAPGMPGISVYGLWWLSLSLLPGSSRVIPTSTTCANAACMATFHQNCNKHPSLAPRAGSDLCQQGEEGDRLWVLTEGAVTALQHLAEPIRLTAPCMIGDSVVLADDLPAFRARSFTIRWGQASGCKVSVCNEGESINCSLSRSLAV